MHKSGMANFISNIFGMKDPGVEFLVTCKGCYFNNITPSNPVSKDTKAYKHLVDITIHYIKQRGLEEFAGFFQDGQYFIDLWAAHLLIDHGKPNAELTERALNIIRTYSDNPLAPAVAEEEKAWLNEHNRISNE
jgi:hypothetical protein